MAARCDTACLKHEAGKPDSISHDITLRLIADRADPHLLWIGTWGGGLNRFDTRTGQFKAWRSVRGQEDTLSSDMVHDVFEDSQGRLWLATGSGLDRFDRKTGKVRRFGTADGVPPDVIFNIQEDASGTL